MNLGRAVSRGGLEEDLELRRLRRGALEIPGAEWC